MVIKNHKGAKYRTLTRLKDYDYTAAGAYYITVCTQNRKCVFGDIFDCQMHLNNFGKIIKHCWHDLPNHYSNIELDYFVIMPNHVHGIINIIDINAVGAGFKPAPTSKINHGLFEIIRAFKTFSSRRVNKLRGMAGNRLWQRNYYDRVVRNEEELNNMRQYIKNNPMRWADDRNNPKNCFM